MCCVKLFRSGDDGVWYEEWWGRRDEAGGWWWADQLAGRKSKCRGWGDAQYGGGRIEKITSRMQKRFDILEYSLEKFQI